MNYSEKIIEALLREDNREYYINDDNDTMRLIDIYNDDTLSVKSRYEVKGETYSRRAAIKAAGGKWDSERSKWYFKECPENFETEAIYNLTYDVYGAKAALIALKDCDSVIEDAIRFANEKGKDNYTKIAHVVRTFQDSLLNRFLKSSNDEAISSYKHVVNKAMTILDDMLRHNLDLFEN